MADKEVSIRWIIGILIYYTCVFTIFTFASGVTNSISIEDGGLSGIDAVINAEGSCQYPRATASEIIWKTATCRNGNVETTEQCTSIEGCNVTTNFLGNSYCEGTINISFYNGGVDTDLCDASAFDNNATLCQLVGCTWVDYEGMSSQQIAELNTPRPNNFLNAIKFLAGFRADFGIQNETLRLLIAIFLFYIPLLILIGSIYMLVPFI